MQLPSIIPWSMAVILIFIVSISPVNAIAFTINGGDSCVPVGSSTDFSIALSDIPQGLSGLNITISISDPSIATITNVTLPAWAELHSTSTLPADQFWLKMVDLQQKVNPGDLNVSLCQISVVGRKGGTSFITVTPIKVEDDIGGRYTITPAQKPLCTGDSTTSSQFQSPSESGTPIPSQTSSDLITTTMSPSSTQVISLQTTKAHASAASLTTQNSGSEMTPSFTETVPLSNLTPESSANLPPAAPASLSLMLPVMSCMVSVVLLVLCKKIEKEKL
jgi:hypothetical protein